MQVGLPAGLGAEVVRVVIERREAIAGGRAFGDVGAYERLTGKIYFAFDPGNRRNARVVDLALAPRNGEERVEAWSDLVIMRPVDRRRGNGVVLLEVANRGSRLAPSVFNRCDFSTSCPAGDGFLFRHGYTLVWVGWQWDVMDSPPAIRSPLALHAPSAGDSIVGLVRSDWTVEVDTRVLPLGHRHGPALSRPYAPASPDDPRNVLTERQDPIGTRRLVPRAEWSFAREDTGGRPVPDRSFIRLASGFRTGRIYELVYVARDPVVVGLGFLAVRDAAAYAKHHPRSEFAARRVIAYGKSQSGRFLRHYLYEGFNTDERGRAALDGVLIDVAGAGRGSFNHRFAGPSRDATTFDTFFHPVDLFPFTSRRQRDPVTGAEDGLLTNPRASRNLPKVMQVNAGYEYWARAASLVHTDVTGTTDIAPHRSERLYAIASGSHNVAPLPTPATSRVGGSTARRGDPLDTRFALRALLEALRRWTDGEPPPPSRYPRIAHGTLVPLDSVRSPTFDGVRPPGATLVPRRIDYGPRWPLGIIDREPPTFGAPYRVLVPQVDSVGNETGGVPSVETLAPVATYMGWQLHPVLSSALGVVDRLAAYEGTVSPLFRTEAERVAARDPRPSLERLYADQAAYRAAVGAAIRRLMAARFLLAEDSAAAAARADSAWAWVRSP